MPLGMISILEEILFICLALTILYGTTANVVLTPKYTSSYMTFTCRAEDPEASSFMIHLICPLVKNGFCFSNCTPHCSLDNRGDCDPNPNVNPISNCRYDTLEQNSIATSYRVNTSQVTVTGEWSCSFKNYKSNSVSLAKYEHFSTTTAHYRKTVQVIFTKNDNEKRDLSQKISTGLSIGASSSTSKHLDLPKTKTAVNEINFLDHVTRPEFVFVLIMLLAISLILNLSFFIRCVLLKSVIKNYYRGIPNRRCILECLCLDVVPNKYMHEQYSRTMNTQNQMAANFYRCQPMFADNTAIYDDLSAASNNSGRLKMRSNQGSENDEESRRANLLQNGGCHVNQSSAASMAGSLTRRYSGAVHPTYFHHGLGNYVIVSGPVASSDPYSIGTTPPGYTLQMVSPIPSAPGSIGRGPCNQNSSSSVHSDESDNDSRTALSASMVTGLPHRQMRVNSQPVDLRDSTRMIDLSQNVMVPINRLEHALNYQPDNVYRSNGSVPLHPWPREQMMATNSSICSLPFCNPSDLRNKNTSEKLPSPPKDDTLVQS